MLNVHSSNWLVLAGVATVSLQPSALAGLISESWDYSQSDGTVVEEANDFNGGMGWPANEWGLTTSDAGFSYEIGDNLDYTAAGWTNDNGPTSGLIDGRGTRGNSSHNIFRSVSDSALTGTVWAAFLLERTDNANSTAFYFADTTSFTQGIGVWSTSDDLSLVAGGSNLQSNGSVLATVSTDGVSDTDTNLVILKFETDYSGVNDRLTAWLNPTDVTSEAQLTATGERAVHDPIGDIWGSDLDPLLRISVDGRSDAQYDQVRVAFGDAGLAELVAVPEPASIVLLAAGAAVVLGRRRHG